jgi:hypothetical protein
MECGRAEELLSDHFEGALDALLTADLEKHLSACAACRSLREVLPEVLSALRTFSELEAPAGLAERAAAAALAAGRPPAVVPVRVPSLPAPMWLAAAATAAALGAGILLAQGTRLDPARAAERLLERSVNMGVYLLERKDRLVEDVRLLRVVIGTAFEGRLERVNDRVDDYKRLLEKRRDADREEQQRKGGAAAVGQGVRVARTIPGNFFFQNTASPGSVQTIVTRSES